MKKIFSFVLLVALAVSSGWTQNWEDALSTDRPDFTESSAVVGKNRFQIETSFLFERQTEGLDQNRFAFPTLLRYGLFDELELRIEGDWYTNFEIDEPGSETHDGYSPFSVGFKYHLFDSGGTFMTPDSGILVNIGIPSGSSVFDQQNVTGEVKLLTEWEFSKRWGLGTNIGVAVDRDDRNKEFISAVATAALGYDWTERLGSFWEFAYQGPESRRDKHALIFDTGVTYFLSPDAQVDLAAGTGLTGDSTPDVFVTAGLSVRF